MAQQPQPTYLEAADQLLQFPEDGRELWHALDTGQRCRQIFRRFGMMTEATQIAWIAGYVLRGHHNFVQNGAREFFRNYDIEKIPESDDVLTSLKALVSCTYVAFHAAGMLQGGQLISPPMVSTRLKDDPIGHAILAAGCLIRDGDESNRITECIEVELKRTGRLSDPLKIHHAVVRAPYTSYHRVKKAFDECGLDWNPQVTRNADILVHSRKVSNTVVEHLASELVGVGDLQHHISQPKTIFKESL